MSAHFLLSSASRRMGVMELQRLSDDALIALFMRARWPKTGGAPVCPTCNMPATGPYNRHRFVCKWCRRQFTLTSGTLLHGRKLPLRTLLVGILLWASSVKGASALQVGRQINVDYRTVFVQFHKYRHAFMVECVGRRVGGPGHDVEVDGCYIGGHVRPANFKKNRRDRRLARNRNPNRRVVVVARERYRRNRTIVTVVRSEGEGVAFLTERVHSETVVHADEAPSWNNLHASHDARRINHQEAYSDGMACTNQAESFFSRLRRLERGQHHRISGPYLLRYATEAAFREDHRRLSVWDITLLILRLALTTGSDPEFRGYWQRARRCLSNGKR